MDFTTITQNAELDAFIQRAEQSPYLALDTEFRRETTYWPELCLVQIACDAEIALIDPLAPGLDIDRLKPLLLNPNCLKIVHAGRQDLEIFYHRWGRVLSPIFDTQLAAMVTPIGDNVSYEKLVETLLGLKINKALQYTNWTVRPLSAAHLAYAASDVAHLNTLRALLIDRIGEKIEWVHEEMAVLMNPDTYENDPQQAWKKIKTKVIGGSNLWGRVKALAAWREKWAQKADRPRNHIMKDELLVDVASKEILHLHEWVGKNTFLAQDPSIFATLKESKPFIPPAAPSTAYDPTVLDLLKALLQHQAFAHRIAPRLIASKDDLIRFLLTDDDQKLRHGWRYDVFGKVAEQLLQGLIALYLDAERRVRVKEVQ